MLSTTTTSGSKRRSMSRVATLLTDSTRCSGTGFDATSTDSSNALTRDACPVAQHRGDEEDEVS